jgi:hypothetical protein
MPSSFDGQSAPFYIQDNITLTNVSTFYNARLNVGKMSGIVSGVLQGLGKRLYLAKNGSSVYRVSNQSSALHSTFLLLSR